MSLEKFPVKHSSGLTALGFDFGTRRIGVACGQSISGTASPLAALKARDGIPDWDQIGKLLDHWQPDLLVIGLPYNMDGSESELLKRAVKFANRLHGRFHLPCYGIDERLSSHAAEELVGSSDQSVDSVAAQLILETWFAELRQRDQPA
ncbi:MAG: Holliday junction resolvase RuvX [Gammaproteobacteria bacterium]|nr:Holliday junction resolvase RuvX [Pseudomonadales bacterium]MCP5347530.1 Holliday junction resolvase RuvX [Pseudomonadales bacterium]